MKYLSSALLGLAAGLLIAGGVAWMRPGPQSDRGRGSIQDVLQANQEALGLDQATLDAAWALADEARADLDARRGRIDEARGRLAVLLDAEAVDRAAMRRQVEQIGAMEAELRVRELEVMLSIRALLDDEQREGLRQRATGDRL